MEGGEGRGGEEGKEATYSHGRPTGMERMEENGALSCEMYFGRVMFNFHVHRCDV